MGPANFCTEYIQYTCIHIYLFMYVFFLFSILLFFFSRYFSSSITVHMYYFSLVLSFSLFLSVYLFMFAMLCVKLRKVLRTLVYFYCRFVCLDKDKMYCVLTAIVYCVLTAVIDNVFCCQGYFNKNVIPFIDNG